MAWQTLKTIEGRCYIPDGADRNAKHPCRACFACQHCSDERCQVCRAACDSNGGLPLSGAADQEEHHAQK